MQTERVQRRMRGEQGFVGGADPRDTRPDGVTILGIGDSGREQFGERNRTIPLVKRSPGRNKARHSGGTKTTDRDAVRIAFGTRGLGSGTGAVEGDRVSRL